MEKINLIKDQLEILANKREELLKKQKEINLEIMSEGLLDIKCGELTDTVSSGIYEEKIIVEQDLKEIDKLLKNSKVVANNDKSKIGIGTKFLAKINFGDETEECEFTLVENKEGLDFNYISISSELGKSIIGKSLNETFQYEMPNGKIARGIILNIEGMSISSDLKTVKDRKNKQAMELRYNQLIEKRQQLMQGGYSASTVKHLGLLNLKISECEFWINHFDEKIKTK